MSRIDRRTFQEQLTGKGVSTNELRGDQRLSGVDVAAADLNGDGSLSSPDELGQLHDGLTRAASTQGDAFFEAAVLAVNSKARQSLTSTGQPALPFRDAALTRAFPDGLQGTLAQGARGQQVVGMQDALSRLGLLDSPSDGVWGPKTSGSLKSFQSSRGLPASGVLDAKSLSALDAALAPTEGAPKPTSPFLDIALERAFPGGLEGELMSGSAGRPVLGLQYSLGRLGFLNSLADGKWGFATTQALQDFQVSKNLHPSGVLDATTLSTLDSALSSQSLVPPASQAANPHAYLSDFDRLPLSKVEIQDRSTPISWNHPEVRAAHGKFVGEYWEVLKTNRAEADCKTLALYLMDQFRAKLKADTGLSLSRPSTPRGSLPDRKWEAYTSTRTGGFFSRSEKLPKVRGGYEVAQQLETLDPRFSLMSGPNLRYAGVDANTVARIATPVHPGLKLDNQGDQSKPEIPVDDLLPGDVIFLDHTGDGRNDHVVNVIGVERDLEGKVRHLKLATGYYDDMKDTLASTDPRGLHEVNNYLEEVRVDLDDDGKVTGSKVTYRSEGLYAVPPDYTASRLIMEMKPGGKIHVGRW